MGTGAWPGSGSPRAATPGQLGFEAPDSSPRTRLLPPKILRSPTDEDSPSPHPLPHTQGTAGGPHGLHSLPPACPEWVMPPAWAPEVPTPHLVTWPATLRRPLDTPLVPVPRPGPAARLTRPPIPR